MNTLTAMRAMVLDAPHQLLQLREVPVPQPGPKQVLLRVHACRKTKSRERRYWT